MIKKSFVVFYKNKILPIFLVLGMFLVVGATSAYGVFLVTNTDANVGAMPTNGVPLYYFMNLMRTSLLFYTVMLFSSYTYFSRVHRDSLEECVSQMPNGLLKLRFSQIIVMLCVELALILPILIEPIVFYFIYGTNSLPFLWYMIKGVLVFFFLSGVAGVFLAACVSLIKNKIAPYLVLLTLVLVNYEFSLKFFSGIYGSIGVDLTRFAMFFRTTPLGATYTVNEHSGIAIQGYQIASMFFLIFFAGLVVFLFSSKGKDLKRFATVAVSGVCIVSSLVFMFLPVATMGFPYGKDKEEMYYSKIEMQEEQEPDFGVTQYDMNLKIGRLLNAEVIMTVDKGNLPKYTMTLYHGYKVSEVMDENKKALAFTQQDDKLTIENSGTLNKIHVKYKGYSNNFYSNTQAVFLPASFPYYPQPGFKKIIATIENLSFSKSVLKNDAKFNVNVSKRGGEVLSSLDGKDGSFSGKSNGVTLISAFIGTTNVDGKEVIYPLFGEGMSEKEVTASVSAYGDFIENYDEVKKIFFIPRVYYPNRELSFAFNDHLIALIDSPKVVERSYLNQKIPDSKMPLRGYIETLDNTSEKSIEMAKGIDPNGLGTFYELCEVMPTDELEQLCNEFMFNDSDKRDCTEFLADLAKGKGVRK